MSSGIKRSLFFSLRTKMMAIYLVVILTLFVLIISALPKLLRSYMLDQSKDDLITTKQIIQETLEETDFQTNAWLRDRLDAVARAKEIEIWICKAPQIDEQGHKRIAVIRLGSSKPDEEMTLSQKSALFIEGVREGLSGEVIQVNLFPEYYSQNTITLAYTTGYVESRHMVEVGPGGSSADNAGDSLTGFQGSVTNLTVEHKAVVLLNIGLKNISEKVSMLISVIVTSFVIVSILAAILIWFMSNSIIQPVNQMREIARSISDGDFSRKAAVTSRDEIADLADAFNRMAQELGEAEQTRQAFIANVSHDFRSPLTSIRGFIQAMLDDVIPQEQYPKYLRIVFDETNRLSKLTNDLLTLSRMDSGQDRLEPVRFDLNEMIRTLTLGFEQRIEEKKLQIRFHFLEDHLFVQADPDKIERVITNLVDNAIKFTEENDTITIETSIVNRKAYVSVTDTGIGMDEETVRHVFERFHKSDRSRGLNKTGMGLGLAIVKQIIVAHGEDITVTSKENEGTHFEFTLPLASQLSLVEKE